MADYTTVADVKSYLRISGAGDDSLLGDLITRASALIDNECGRWFTAVSATRTYDATGEHISQDRRQLFLDADLLSVTSITNGDGTTVDPGDYRLRPPNWSPYFMISLKIDSGLTWTFDTDPESAISVSGSWGYSATPPEPVVQAAIRLTAWLYRQRDTGAETGEVEITERGVSVAPARLPRDVMELLAPYVRLTIRG